MLSIQRIASAILLVLVSYFLIIFISITPYHYSYLNILSVNNENKKFENDYWGTSIKELINKSDFLKGGGKLAFCGVNKGVVKNYLKNKNFSKIKIVNPDEKYDFMIMTNRTVWSENILSWNIKDEDKITSCFDRFKGKNLSVVKRNKLILSIIRKNK